jgi:hypothetical protein
MLRSLVGSDLCIRDRVAVGERLALVERVRPLQGGALVLFEAVAIIVRRAHVLLLSARSAISGSR